MLLAQMFQNVLLLPANCSCKAKVQHSLVVTVCKVQDAASHTCRCLCYNTGLTLLLLLPKGAAGDTPGPRYAVSLPRYAVPLRCIFVQAH
jgi:hypothetical protein